MAKVTGIGGVFFKAKSDPKALAQWYAQHLGLQLEPWGGVILKWPEDKGKDGGQTVWHVAAQGNDWFEAPFMINYRVDDLEALVAQLRRDGVTIAKEQSDETGKFAWVVDPDGNKVELWEPPA